MTNVKGENIRKIRDYVIGEKDGFVDFFPRYIQLEHTNRCNAHCIMCNHFFLGNSGTDELQEKLVKKIEPILPYCELIMLNGDGEPFLCRNIGNYAKLYKKYGVRISANTNLCALSPDGIRQYGKYIDYLNVSCDGVSKETFEFIRRGLDFDRFKENLRVLTSEFPHMRVNLDCVLMTHNITEAADIVKFAKENGVASVHFNLLRTNPRIGNQADCIFNYPSLAAKCINKAIETANFLDIEIVCPRLGSAKTDAQAESELASLMAVNRDALIKERLQNIDVTDHDSIAEDYLNIEACANDFNNSTFNGGKYCSWALERCYIDIAGNVSTCCFNVHHYMGNLYNAESFDEIWNGSNYRNLRLKMAVNILPEWCRNCTWFRGESKYLTKGLEFPY